MATELPEHEKPRKLGAELVVQKGARSLGTSQPDKLLSRDLRLLTDFIDIYCRSKHADEPRVRMNLKMYDIVAIAGEELTLCPMCERLLTHALVKRSTCPLDPKPACKHCPQHCYHPKYREQIREVMKYSGRKLVMSGRLDYLFKLLF